MSAPAAEISVKSGEAHRQRTSPRANPSERYNTQMGPGSQKIRDELSSESARQGFDDSFRFHGHRSYPR